jgi:hypothetical protein
MLIIAMHQSSHISLIVCYYTLRSSTTDLKYSPPYSKAIKWPDFSEVEAEAEAVTRMVAFSAGKYP